MSIFEKLFGTQTPAPAPVQSAPTGVANPGQPLPGTQSTAQTAPNGTVPAQGQNFNVGNPDPNTQQSPLDTFKDVWQTPAVDPNAAPAGMFANLDPKKLMESARQIDFAKSITPETLQKIQAGGPEAVQALAEAMNSVTQNVYAQSALATTKIVEQALGKAKTDYEAQLPTLVKKFSTNETLLENNPLLSNPAIQPLVGALQEQLIRKNPNASSVEIRQQVQDYFAALGQSFAPKPAQSAADKAARAEEDWSKFL